MLAFICPHCGIRLQMDERFAGQPVECGGCHRAVNVPSAFKENSAPSPQVNPDVLAFLAAAQAEDELGRLGPYRILSVLGSGGMGVVFRAEDPRLQREVALKIMLPSLAANPVARERFLREARAAAALEHDHVVRLYEVAEENGVPFLAMQLLEGRSLEERLRREKRLPIREVMRIGRETAEALWAAHQKGLVHRDVKPSNLWLEGERGRVKVLDFGLVGAAGAPSQLTQLGTVIGSPGYIAPELARGGTTDPRGDLFSLGCVMYRMCTGELPFKGTDLVSFLAVAALETPRPIREMNSTVPPTLSKLVLKMLEQDPADRPISARMVAETIRAVEADEPSRQVPKIGVPRALSRSEVGTTLVDQPPSRGGGSEVARPSRTPSQVRKVEDRPPISDVVAVADEPTQTDAPLPRHDDIRSPTSPIPFVVAGLVLLGLAILAIGGVGTWWVLKSRVGSSASSGTPATDKRVEPFPLDRDKGKEPNPPPQAENDGPKGWTVLFRADDPNVWNTVSNGEKYAIPLHKAPARIRYLRLRRMDTRETLIVPMSRAQLDRATEPVGAGGYAWNGTAKLEWGGRHLGIAQGPRLKFPIKRGLIAVFNVGWDVFVGSGFGHQCFNDNTGQYFCWRGQQIKRTVFEIAVTDDDLTGEERRCLLSN
jgi:serine/threonine protein kinase